MTLLHVYFTLRNQQAFQRLLDRDRSTGTAQSGQSASASKSWTRKNIASALEVNAFDHLGRTVLHLACASTEPASLEYTRLLLAHPSVNVNLVDKENHWTALHRAMYAGNIEVAIMLLKRTDTDTFIKDMEGYTAFDLYNSTVRSANPTSLKDGYGELLMWGANRNATLGLGDSNDRTHPDYVTIPKKDTLPPANRTLEERFRLARVQGVSMSKLHTVILTDEARDNVRLCGFGSGGRLGPFSHTLYAPTPLALSSHSIVSVALGQDHTLALTSAGEIISWGLNRFAQLGYVVESSQGDSTDELIQTTPRKVGHLKKEVIRGVAACKTASACWSDSDMWTWGTNGGQLGYSKISTPIQVLPRKVSIITQPILDVSMSETVMVCLFVTGEVACMWNGGISRINFPANAFPSDISMVYRPPQAIRGPAITKLAGCEDSFAALSSNGEVFTFSSPTITEADGSASGAPAGASRGQIKPQRVWALRRQWSGVRDVDIGGNGALIVCTHSGHVFVRSRNLKAGTTSSGAKTFKFQRVAHVQRAVAVCANSTGSFGALRVDYKPTPVSVSGRHFSADIAAIAPFISEAVMLQDMNVSLGAVVNTDGDLEDSSIIDDITGVAKLVSILCSQANRVRPSIGGGKHGADLAMRTGDKFEIAAHRIILVTRCLPLREVLGGKGAARDESSKVSVSFTPRPLNVLGSASPGSPVLQFTGISPLSLLILLHYVYADGVLAVWDHRIESIFETQFSSLGVSATQVKADLTTLARLLDLPHLTSALQSVGKRDAKLSARCDFRWLFDQAQLSGPSRLNVCQDPIAPDVALHLADKTVYTHSTVLRARSAFFSALFSDEDWTVERRDDAGVVDVELGHHNWLVMQFVLHFVCFGDETMFETLEFVNNVDELLDFLFLVISAANELLLNRLVLLCSRIIVKHLNTYNACFLLTDAIHFNAVELADRIQDYMVANMEMLLESRILDDLDLRVVRKLSEHTRAQQETHSPVSRSNKLAHAALEKHRDWLAFQDIPVPFVPSQKVLVAKDSLRLSPPGSARKPIGRQLRLYSPTASPILRPSVMPQPPPGDEIFAMDDADCAAPLRLNSVQTSTSEEMIAPVPTTGSAKPGWKKTPVMPRTDLKAIMAEAESGWRQTHTRTLGDHGSALGSDTQLVIGNGAGAAGTGMLVNVPTRPAQGAGMPPRPGRIPGQSWPSDGPPTPRRVPSNPSIAREPEPAPALMASRTSATARTTAPVQPDPRSPQPIMGPTITPVRQTSNTSASTSTRGGSPRKPSLGGAWTPLPVRPIAAPTVSTSSLSFTEIQRMQELQGTTSTAKDKRSLRDIQEEERARQQEADFLQWWAAEEERVRLETLQQEQVTPRTEANRQNKGKGSKGRFQKARTERPQERKPSGALKQ